MNGPRVSDCGPREGNGWIPVPGERGLGCGAVHDRTNVSIGLDAQVDRRADSRSKRVKFFQPVIPNQRFLQPTSAYTDNENFTAIIPHLRALDAPQTPQLQPTL